LGLVIKLKRFRHKLAAIDKRLITGDLDGRQYPAG
jgi:hypothetical protein